MESINIPNAILSSGQYVPLIGIGMAVAAFSPLEIVKAVIRAIEVGYRHFDTASLYQTEQFLGEAIVEALHLGLIKSRDELFITSKLWCSDAHHDLVLPALQKSLQNLQLEYLDLYLVHWPVSSKHGKYENPIPKEDLMPMNFKAVWTDMEECQRLGLTKSIGVSNFSIKKLQDLLAMATIPPSVNQVEMNPLWQQKKLREYCKDKGILVAAYSPLGGPGTRFGSNRVVENEVINGIAKAKGKTVAQVCLRWAYEKGVSVVVKSFNEKRLKENVDIFDWALSEEEDEKINQILHQRRTQTGEFFVSGNGAYKTPTELWDGDF